MARRKSRLGNLSRAELEDIVEEVAIRRPELGALVDRPRRGKGRVKPGVVLAQVDAVFEGMDHRNWRSSYSVAGDLSSIAESAAALLATGDVTSAVRTLCELAEGIRENYGTFHDEEGEVARVIDEAAARERDRPRPPRRIGPGNPATLVRYRSVAFLDR